LYRLLWFTVTWRSSILNRGLCAQLPVAVPITVPKGFQWWVPPYTPPAPQVVRETVTVLVTATVDGRVAMWTWDHEQRVVRALYACRAGFRSLWCRGDPWTKSDG
jgi:hypothetical protein